MTDTLRNTCGGCGMPEQLPGLACGFCGHTVEMPKGALIAAGTMSGAVKVEEVIGWKGLDVTSAGLLQSPMFKQDGAWAPGEWKVARCHRPGSDHVPEHADMAAVPPVNDCAGQGHGCGYYAGRTREHLMQMGYQRYTEDDPSVLVQVQLAGKIIPASNGWRAQKIRPRVIHVPHELWRVGAKLKDNYGPYGVEVAMDTTIILPKDATPEWCPKCTAKWEGRGLNCGHCGFTLNG